MGDSKKYVLDLNDSVVSALSKQIELLLAPYQPTGPIALACSGGPDSAAMAMVTASLFHACQRPLYLFHVHHGMQRQADQWARQVQDLGQLLSIPVELAHVKVDLKSGLGPEASARAARYQAIQSMAINRDVAAVLLAHHAQDQAETVLMRLLRGSGVAGLAGMQAVSKTDQVSWLRPWLGVSKGDIDAVVKQFGHATGWQPVVDPSNVDAQLGRGALRSQIIPALTQRWPAWVANFSRHATQAAQANQLLDEFADNLLTDVGFDGLTHSFDLQAWRKLSEPQQALVLRRWLSLSRVPMPTTKKLDELMKQLRGLHALGQDRDMLWQHGQHQVKCQSKRVILSSR